MNLPVKHFAQVLGEPRKAFDDDSQDAYNNGKLLKRVHWVWVYKLFNAFGRVMLQMCPKIFLKSAG
jgi:hypothetical protein